MARHSFNARLENNNPDTSKWRDRIGEFGDGVAGIGAVAGVGVSVASIAIVAAVTNNGPAIAGSWFGACAAVAAAGVSAAAVGAPKTPRPVARKLGMVFPTLAALTAGSIFVAYKVGTAPTPPVAPTRETPAAAMVVPDCSSQQARDAIAQAQAQGLKPACRTATP